MLPARNSGSSQRTSHLSSKQDAITCSIPKNRSEETLSNIQKNRSEGTDKAGKIGIHAGCFDRPVVFSELENDT